MESGLSDHDVIKRLLGSRLVTSAQLDDCRARIGGSRQHDVDAIGARLCADRILTPWQFTQIRAGQETFYLEHTGIGR